MNTYNQFCEFMTEAINTEAMKHGNSLISVDEVKTMPEAYTAYTMTAHIAQNAG